MGFCFWSTGKFEEARPWYERAVEAKQKGDVHGRVNHASLARSLRAGARCLRRLGELAQAEKWEAEALKQEQLSKEQPD